MNVTLDHCVLHVSDWARSNDFYARVLGAETVPRGAGFMYRFGRQQLNLHGPGLDPDPVARVPVPPGGSDLCFAWEGPISEAVRHLERQGVAVELGPVPRFGARGEGASVYFRDPDGSLLEFISYPPLPPAPSPAGGEGERERQSAITRVGSGSPSPLAGEGRGGG